MTKTKTPLIGDRTDRKDRNESEISINNIKSINNIIYHKAEGNKEKVLFYLYPNKELSYKEIEEGTGIKETNLMNITSRDYALIEASPEKKENRKTFRLTARGKEAVENKSKLFDLRNAPKVKKEETIEQIEEISNFLEMYKSELKPSNGDLIIDFNKIVEHSPALADNFLSNPEETFSLFENSNEILFDNGVKFRVINIPNTEKSPIKSIRAKHTNRLIAVEGIVKKMGQVRPRVVNSIFECPNCGSRIAIKQLENHLREPSRCSCGRKGGFKLITNDLENTAKLVIEELPEFVKGSENVSQLKCVISNNLTNEENLKLVSPGKKIKANGILKLVSNKTKTGATSTVFDYLLDLNSVEGKVEEEIIISEQDEKEIEKLAKGIELEGNLDVLTGQFAPYIEGHKKIKEAIICADIASDNETAKDGTLIKNTINCGIIGDPGLAKTQLIKFNEQVVPGSRYASGSSASAVGLTASVVKDEFLGGWTVEAGAIPLANGSVVMIDEINKISEDEICKLHEVMYDQMITINKANCHMTLKCDVSIIACANPIKEKFDRFIPITEQFGFGSTLINRFDIIFAVTDKIDAEKDKIIVQKMMEKKKHFLSKKVNLELLKKFIYYIRKRPNPVFTEDAINKVSEAYTQIRKSLGGNNSINSFLINPRTAQAINSFSTCYAKLRLSDRVEVVDVTNALNLLLYSYKTLGLVPNLVVKSERIGKKIGGEKN